MAHSTQDPCHCARSAVLFSHSITESVSLLKNNALCHLRSIGQASLCRQVKRCIRRNKEYSQNFLSRSERRTDLEGGKWEGDFTSTPWSDLSIIKAAAAAASESRPLSWWKLPTHYGCSFSDKLLASARILNCTRLHTQVTHKPQQLKQVKATQTQQFSAHAQNAPWEMQPASAGPGKFSFHTLSASLKFSFPDSFIPPNEASPVSRSPLFK